jgi:peptide/nickel transport system permease protein
MTPLISKDSRKIYSRRIKGFWQEFSHNRIGFVGLLLLSVYIIMALFAPWLTPYDPLASTRVAESYAAPSWMKIFPQYKDHPDTMEIYPEWEVAEGSKYIVAGRKAEGTINLKGAEVQEVNIRLTTSFNYPYHVQPMRFVSSFKWSVHNVTNAWWSAELTLVNVNGTPTKIWFEPWTNLNLSLGIEGDSNDYWLLKKIGYTDPKATNLARIVFSSPIKGEYNLIFRASIMPAGNPQNMTAEISFRDFKFFVPGLVHGILGTDFLGTDVFSQLIYGSRLSLAIGLIAAAVATSIGVLVGTVSGYLGGAVDEISMRIVDIMLCLPTLPLLLTLVKVFGKNVFYIVLFIAVFGWLGLSRVIRSQILYFRETAFVECAVASGASKPYIIVKHLIPNIVPVALASLILSVPGAVLAEAGLSFLGFGDPRVPTWGKMLNYAFGHGAFENFAWWWALPPGLAITFLSLAFVFMGFAIDEIVNPRLRRRR